jgi:hypothetical protein
MSVKDERCVDQREVELTQQQEKLKEQQETLQRQQEELKVQQAQAQQAAAEAAAKLQHEIQEAELRKQQAQQAQQAQAARDAELAPKRRQCTEACERCVDEDCASKAAMHFDWAPCNAWRAGRSNMGEAVIMSSCPSTLGLPSVAGKDCSQLCHDMFQ